MGDESKPTEPRRSQRQDYFWSGLGVECGISVSNSTHNFWLDYTHCVPGPLSCLPVITPPQLQPDSPGSQAEGSLTTS